MYMYSSLHTIHCASENNSILPKQNSRHDGRAWLGRVCSHIRAFGFSYSHIKEISVLKACWTDMTQVYYRIAGKFGGELNLAVWRTAWATTKLKSAKISYLHIHCIPMAIPYQTAKSKSTNMFEMAIWDPTANFNSHQYSSYMVLCWGEHWWIIYVGSRMCHVYLLLVGETVYL